jgi:hypothetical protein
MGSWRIRAAKAGNFVLPAGAAHRCARCTDWLSTGEQSGAWASPGLDRDRVIGTIAVRVPGGADSRDLEAVLRAVRRAGA